MAATILASCTRCGACLEECPSHAIIAASPIYVVDPDLCEEHQRCMAVCPETAILLKPQQEPKKDERRK